MEDIKIDTDIFTTEPIVSLKNYYVDSEETIEFMARICYQSKNRGQKSKEALLTALKDNNESPIEHACATFVIKNVSRNLTHELVRHRLASFCELSQRSVNVGNQKVVIPESIRKNLEAYEIFLDVVEKSMDGYKKLIELGIPKEDARYGLISGVTTEIGITANFREYLHIINLRTSKRAHWEIRKVASEIEKQLHQIAPIIF